MKDKTVLVTGGAGAIGSNLVRTLASSGNKVIVIDDLSSGNAANCPASSNVDLRIGSILDDKLLSDVFSGRGVDVVFHLAAHFANQNSVEHPQKDMLTNALGTLKLLELAQKSGTKKFVYTSSSCVYGGSESDLTEDLVFKLETPYAISKLCGEEYARFFHDFYRMNVVILRYFNAYGPGDPPGIYRNVIPNFMKLAVNNEPLVITGTGDETRDFTYMDDVINGTILASEKDAAVGQTLNIGAGREVRIIYMAELINKISGNKAPIKFVERRKWDKIARRVANIEKSKRILGYEPKVRFEDGIEKTFRWFKDNYSKISAAERAGG